MTMQLEYNTGRNPNSVKVSTIYYRRPLKGKEAGWIITGDGHPYRQIEYLRRGFEVVLNGLEVYDPKRPASEFGRVNRWKTILEHPEGPALFPADQVITNLWYRWPPVPGVRFPSIAGMEITELECPQCSEERIFHDPRHCAGHLQNEHKWDIASIIAYGKDIDVDFNEKVRKAGKMVYVFQASDEPDPGKYSKLGEEDLDPQVQIKKPAAYEEPVKKQHICPDCGEEFSIALALAGHRRSHNGDRT